MWRTWELPLVSGSPQSGGPHPGILGAQPTEGAIRPMHAATIALQLAIDQTRSPTAETAMKIQTMTFAEPLYCLGLTIVRTPFIGQNELCVTDDYGNLVECEAIGHVLAYSADTQIH